MKESGLHANRFGFGQYSHDNLFSSEKARLGGDTTYI